MKLLLDSCSPHIIIIAAAFTNVNLCESQKEKVSTIFFYLRSVYATFYIQSGVCLNVFLFDPVLEKVYIMFLLVQKKLHDE